MVLPLYISWIGKNKPDAVTVKVAVICLLSSTPLIETVFEPFKSNVYFPAVFEPFKSNLYFPGEIEDGSLFQV